MSTATQNDQASNGKAANVGVMEALAECTNNWSGWTKRLTERKKPVPLRKLLSPNALLWGLTRGEIEHIPLVPQLSQLRKRRSKAADQDWDGLANAWIPESRTPSNASFAVEALAWCHALPALVNRLTSDTWSRLLASLLQLSQVASDPDCPIGPSVHLLLAGELPLSLAYVLPELSACSSQKRPGRQIIDESLDQLFDGEGLPHAKDLASLQLFLASGVRSISMDQEIKKGRLKKATRLQFDWMTRQTLRWSRADGTLILGTTDDRPYFDELLKAALEMTGDEADAVACQVLRGRRKATSRVLDDTPVPSEHSEWSELAVLRTDWSAEQAYLAVDFAAKKLELEISTHGQQLLRGSSVPRISVDDEPLSLTSEWEELCWESDDDMDYIELEAHLTRKWRVQRQLLLARNGRFAFLADAVLGPDAGLIAYEHKLPLADSIRLEQPEETCEAFLIHQHRLGTVIPLSLSEWKTDSHDGRLQANSATLTMERFGTALYAPLFIDLDPGRRRKALTWRRLTVGENLQVVPADVAVAYRVQIGKSQWVFYRALDRPGNRTFLGVNLTSEFLAAEFDTDGEIEPLIDIEGCVES